MKIHLTNEEEVALIDKSLDAREYSYSPYSNFRVGAALLTSCGKILTGCNVENISYGLGICAERTVYCKAVSEGFRKFKAVAVSSDVEGNFLYPCGACRQFMAEFGDLLVYVVSRDRTYLQKTLEELLPCSFASDILTNAQKS